MCILWRNVSSNPKTDLGAHVFNPGIWETEAVDLWVQGQPGPQNKFQDRQGYTRKPCLKQQQQTPKPTG